MYKKRVKKVRKSVDIKVALTFIVVVYLFRR